MSGWRRLLAWGLAALCGLWALAARADAPPPRTELRVVGDNNFPPFLFLDAQGRPQGYTVDLWRLWEQKTGVRVQLSALQWDLAQRTLQAGDADVIDTIYRTPQREALYDFSAPYANQAGAIYRHVSVTGIRDLAGLQGFLVGVQAGDACIDHLTRAGITSLRAFPTYTALLDAAASGQVRLFCMDDHPAGYYLYQRGLHQAYVKAFDVYQGAVTHAVRKGDTQTLALVERGMAAITPGEREALRQRWLSVPDAPRRALPTAMLWTVAATAGVALLLVTWVLALRRLVRRRTAELEREREALVATINAIPDLVWLKDSEGRYLACNRRFEQLYGVPERALIGRTDYDFVDVATADAFRDNDRRAIEAGVPCSNEEVLAFASDGHRERVQTLKTPLRSHDGRLIGVLGIARDLTALLEARDALVEERARLQRLQALTDAADWTVDLATLRWRWAAEHDRLLGLSPGERKPSLDTLLQAVAAADRDRVRAALVGAQAGVVPSVIPLALIGTPASPRPAELRLQAEYDEQGRQVRLHGVTRVLPAPPPAGPANPERLTP